MADGTAETLRKQASGNVITRLQVQGAEVEAVIEKLKSIPGTKEVLPLEPENNRLEIQSDHNISEVIFRTAVKNKWIITEMIPVETKLEDIFRDLTLN